MHYYIITKITVTFKNMFAIRNKISIYLRDENPITITPRSFMHRKNLEISSCNVVLTILMQAYPGLRAVSPVQLETWLMQALSGCAYLRSTYMARLLLVFGSCAIS